MVLKKYKQPARIFILYPNRIIKKEFMKGTSETIKTDTGEAFTIKGITPLVDSEGITYYFADRTDSSIFNPSTVLADMRHFEAQNKNIKESIDNIVNILRAEKTTTKDGKSIKFEMSTKLKQIKQILEELDLNKQYKTENLKISAETQFEVLENNLIEGLAKKNKIPTLVILTLLGCGALMGMFMGVYIGGDTLNQQDYNENYYTPLPEENKTIVVNYIHLSDYYNKMKDTLPSVNILLPVLCIIWISIIIYELYEKHKHIRFIRSVYDEEY